MEELNLAFRSKQMLGTLKNSTYQTVLHLNSQQYVVKRSLIFLTVMLVISILGMAMLVVVLMKLDMSSDSTGLNTGC